mmetsp:Transcript_15825/g.31506  ORF Transcript_15825/g.31506 Transcript_15825/m.31506 type:complete len:202 (-) Transcript_15825:165-770(-)
MRGRRRHETVADGVRAAQKYLEHGWTWRIRRSDFDGDLLEGAALEDPVQTPAGGRAAGEQHTKGQEVAMISGTGPSKTVRCPPHSAGLMGAGLRRGRVWRTLQFGFTRPLPPDKSIWPGVLAASWTTNRCQGRYIPWRLTHHLSSCQVEKKDARYPPSHRVRKMDALSKNLLSSHTCYVAFLVHFQSFLIVGASCTDAAVM